MDKCRQACQYNTLDGCKVEKYRGVCPLTNTVKPITEYKMTNADRVRSMSDEELAEFIVTNIIELRHPFVRDLAYSEWLKWLQQPAEGE